MTPVSDPPRTYRSTELAKRAGVTFRQIDYWARAGWLIPSVSDTQGSGTWRRFDAGDVLIAAILKELGLDWVRQKAEATGRLLRKHKEELLSAAAHGKILAV